MSTNQQGKQHRDQEKQERDELNAIIGKLVMATLGLAGDLHKVQVRRLWGNYYRVNILVGPDAASAKVADSYFLKMDGDGNIIESTPNFQRPHTVKPRSD
jgi:hypothetical protein